MLPTYKLLRVPYPFEESILRPTSSGSGTVHRALLVTDWIIGANGIWSGYIKGRRRNRFMIAIYLVDQH